MKTKAEIINNAASKLLMTGVTINATPADVELMLDRLDDLMAELDSRNIQTGYNSLDSDVNAPSGLQRWMNEAVSSALALRVCPDFGISPPPELIAAANTSMSNLSARLARVNQVQYPSRAPVGSGQRWLGRFRSHYGQAAQYPNDSDTQNAVQYSVSTYKVDFAPYLQIEESLTGFTYEATSGINVQSSSYDGNILTMVVEFEASVIGQINIKATGDMGTVVPRSLYFNIKNQAQTGVVT